MVQEPDRDDEEKENDQGDDERDEHVDATAREVAVCGVFGFRGCFLKRRNEVRRGERVLLRRSKGGRKKRKREISTSEQNIFYAMCQCQCI